MSNPVSPGSMRWPASLGLVLGLLLPLAVSAESANLQVAPAPPPAPPAHLVRELLEEDAQRALVNERLNHSPKTSTAPGVPIINLTPAASASPSDTAPDNTPSPAPPVKSAPSARLKGIVGVGGQLSAIVSIEGQDVMYRAGQPLPAMGYDSGLRLVKIATPCAEFTDTRHDTETTISVCLNEVQP